MNDLSPIFRMVIIGGMFALLAVVVIRDGAANAGTAYMLGGVIGTALGINYLHRGGKGGNDE